jgi:hypothetical protein
MFAKRVASLGLRSARSYSISSSSAYQQTIKNLMINSETKVIYQGMQWASRCIAGSSNDQCRIHRKAGNVSTRALST